MTIMRVNKWLLSILQIHSKGVVCLISNAHALCALISYYAFVINLL